MPAGCTPRPDVDHCCLLNVLHDLGWGLMCPATRSTPCEEFRRPGACWMYSFTVQMKPPLWFPYAAGFGAPWESSSLEVWMRAASLFANLISPVKDCLSMSKFWMLAVSVARLHLKGIWAFSNKPPLWFPYAAGFGAPSESSSLEVSMRATSLFANLISSMKNCLSTSKFWMLSVSVAQMDSS